MALPNGVRVDDEGNVAFEGRSGQTLLLNILLRAKFAKPFEPITFLNEWMAELIRRLHTRFVAGLPPQPSSPALPLFGDDPETRQDIVCAIVADASHSGWWTWSREKRAEFIRDVVCAPRPSLTRPSKRCCYRCRTGSNPLAVSWPRPIRAGPVIFHHDAG